jgi:hypothetical protein
MDCGYDAFAVCHPWPQLLPEVSIQEWDASVLPENQFHLFCGSDPALRIRLESDWTGDICQDNQAACYREEYSYGGARGGVYGGKPVIWFNDDGDEGNLSDGFEFTPAGRRAVMAHELGHVFGLDDAYPHSPSCTPPPPVPTIMDGATQQLQGNGKYLVTGSCSASLGPLASDVADVQALYQHQPVQDFTTANLHSDAILQFKDTNWAESDYKVDIDIWDPVTQTGIFIGSFEWDDGTAGKGHFPDGTAMDGVTHPGYFWDKSLVSTLLGNYRFCITAQSAVYGLGQEDTVCKQETLYPDDVDGDGWTGVDEQWWPLCRKYAGGGFSDFERDDDDDGKPNDGCPAIGASESGAQCDNAVNDDPSSDPLVNDGCPTFGQYSESAFSILTIFNIGCSYYSWGWPADLHRVGQSQLRLDLQDLGSYLVPGRFNTSPGDPGYDMRWDIEPGRGGLAFWINITDMGSVFQPAHFPTMPPFYGTNPWNGPACIIQ